MSRRAQAKRFIDNDDYVVYPDTDGDEDVVYAYHAINDK
jgi:hypothetical protein